MTVKSTISARVISNKPLQKGKDCKYFRMALALAKPVKKVVPGQFIHIRLDSKKHILPRPFTIFDVKNSGRIVEVVYQKVGQGTELMSRLSTRGGSALGGRPSDKVRVLCPLGNGFKIDKKVHPVRKTSNGDKDIAHFSKHNRELSNGARMHILVGGGIGLAGLYLLLKELVASEKRHCEPEGRGNLKIGKRDCFADASTGRPVGARNNNIGNDSNIYLFIGARSKDDLCLLTEFRKLCDNIVVTTEDGSSGPKGFITSALDNFLGSHLLPLTFSDIAIYSCGPAGMSQAVRKIAVSKNISCQLSLEARMACGVGLCRVCVCRTVKGYGTVCEDGPVFDAEELSKA